MNTLEFRQASGLRKSVYHVLTDAQIDSLKADILAINADVSVFRFNEGPCTCYFDDVDIIYVKGMERAKTAGVTIKWNNFMRRTVYGSDYQQNQTKTNKRRSLCVS